MTDQLFLIYKPYKMLSQFLSNDRHQRNKQFLGDLYNFPPESMAVGRLDETSEGLLLITTNGALSNYINKIGKIEKEYYAQVDGIVTKAAIQQLCFGVEISVNGKNYKTKECKAFKLEKEPVLPKTNQKIREERHGPTSWVSITIKEGKFRQVRKMCAAVGFPVLRLIRVRIGDFTIADLNDKVVMPISIKENKSL